MRLFAISDLHVGHPKNRAALGELPHHPNDWLILGGDIGETVEHLDAAFDCAQERFAKVLWVPGNHELYSTPKDPCTLRGVARYEHLVRHCQARGVVTPEDPYIEWPGEGPPTIIAPLFLLYDYSFAPDGMNPEQARVWAREAGIVSTDERYLHAEPFASKEAWCAERLQLTRQRLATQVPDGHRLVLINHWPLRRDLIRLFRIPRFTPWCGTTATETWHTELPVDVVVSGHLHMRATDWRDGVRFEEVALGYPRHWRQAQGIAHYVRQILPGPPTPLDGWAGPIWHR
ncbi:MAG: metallophosphoesterase [Myxococcota bacterium]